MKSVRDLIKIISIPNEELESAAQLHTLCKSYYVPVGCNPLI